MAKVNSNQSKGSSQSQTNLPRPNSAISSCSTKESTVSTNKFKRNYTQEIDENEKPAFAIHSFSAASTPTVSLNPAGLEAVRVGDNFSMTLYHSQQLNSIIALQRRVDMEKFFGVNLYLPSERRFDSLVVECKQLPRRYNPVTFLETICSMQRKRNTEKSHHALSIVRNPKHIRDIYIERLLVRWWYAFPMLIKNRENYYEILADSGFYIENSLEKEEGKDDAPLIREAVKLKEAAKDSMKYELFFDERIKQTDTCFADTSFRDLTIKENSTKRKLKIMNRSKTSASESMFRETVNVNLQKNSEKKKFKYSSDKLYFPNFENKENSRIEEWVKPTNSKLSLLISTGCNSMQSQIGNVKPKKLHKPTNYFNRDIITDYKIPNINILSEKTIFASSSKSKNTEKVLKENKKSKSSTSKKLKSTSLSRTSNKIKSNSKSSNNSKNSNRPKSAPVGKKKSLSRRPPSALEQKALRASPIERLAYFSKHSQIFKIGEKDHVLKAPEYWSRLFRSTKINISEISVTPQDGQLLTTENYNDFEDNEDREQSGEEMTVNCQYYSDADLLYDVLHQHLHECLLKRIYSRIKLHFRATLFPAVQEIISNQMMSALQYQMNSALSEATIAAKEYLRTEYIRQLRFAYVQEARKRELESVTRVPGFWGLFESQYGNILDARKHDIRPSYSVLARLQTPVLVQLISLAISRQILALDLQLNRLREALYPYFTTNVELSRLERYREELVDELLYFKTIYESNCAAMWTDIDTHKTKMNMCNGVQI